MRLATALGALFLLAGCQTQKLEFPKYLGICVPVKDQMAMVCHLSPVTEKDEDASRI